MREISIYIHIPFCERKCHYCAFNSFTANQDLIDDYVDFLVKEIEKRKLKDVVIKTIYLGGGTPSLLSVCQIKKIFDVLYENFDIFDNAEITIEANPNSITEEKLIAWKNLRINRLSIGVQTLNDKNLKKIGRLHDKKMALEKIGLARKYFANVSVDLIVGLENEDGKELCKHAKKVLEFGVKHISCYLLEVYETAKISQMIKQNQFRPLSDSETVSAFNKLSNYLQDAGMERYEISNFAFSGFESKHNLNYWNRGEYLGFGLSAHSFIDGTRIQNAESLEEYKNSVVFVENLSLKEEIEEIVMLGLRCSLGVNLGQLNDLGYDIKTNKYFDDYLREDILILKQDKLFLNPVFYHLSNTIISNLLPD